MADHGARETTHDRFIDEIRSSPEFIAGVAADPSKAEALEAIELGIQELRRMDESIDAFDAIQQATAARRDLSMKVRLIKIGRILAEVRAAGRRLN